MILASTILNVKFAYCNRYTNRLVDIVTKRAHHYTSQTVLIISTIISEEQYNYSWFKFILLVNVDSPKANATLVETHLRVKLQQPKILASCACDCHYLIHHELHY